MGANEKVAAALHRSTRVVVTPMSEGGGYVVRGTDDIDVAVLAVARECADEDRYWSDEPTTIPSLFHHGWMRWNPCHESSCYDGGGHRGHLDIVSGSGRGNWQGFWFDNQWAVA